MEAWREELYHGKEWKNHKYIRKEGNRYIYEEPKSHSGNAIQNNVQEALANKPGADGELKRGNLPADLKDRLSLFIKGGSKIDGFSKFIEYAEAENPGLTHDKIKYIVNNFDKIVPESDRLYIGSNIIETVLHMDPSKFTDADKNKAAKALFEVWNESYVDPKYGKNRNNDVTHSDSSTAIYKGSLGGTAIIHRM